LSRYDALAIGPPGQTASQNLLYGRSHSPRPRTIS
jgi:hypothetical protein